MRDYSYQDMLRMQEDAAHRVREMKKRATIVMEDETAPTETTVSAERKGLVQQLLSDGDSVLILSILALISGESSDHLTDLALLYILL